MVKLMRPNLLFIFTISSPKLTCWKGPALVKSHLQGSFHPAHSFYSSPGSKAGCELACPALLPGDQSYVCFCCSWAVLCLVMNHSTKDLTVCIDGARLANICILPSFPWMAPVHCVAYPSLKGTFPPQQLWFPGYTVVYQLPPETQLQTLTQLQMWMLQTWIAPVPGVLGKIWGCIFSCVRPFYEWAVSDQDRSTNISLRV